MFIFAYCNHFYLTWTPILSQMVYSYYTYISKWHRKNKPYLSSSTHPTPPPLQQQQNEESKKIHFHFRFVHILYKYTHIIVSFPFIEFYSYQDWVLLCLNHSCSPTPTRYWHSNKLELYWSFQFYTLFSLNKLSDEWSAAHIIYDFECMTK